MEAGRRRRRSASPRPRNLLSWDDYVHTLPYVLDISDLSWDDDDAPLTLHTYVPYVHAATGTIRYTAVEVLLPVNNSNKRARVADDDDDTDVLRRQLPEVAPGSGDDDCAICLQDLVGSPEKEEEATPRAMPCSHAFHERCIFPWLRRNLACPLCRRPLPLPTPQQKKTSPPQQQYDHHDEDLPTPPQHQHDYHDDDRLQMTMPVPR